MPGLDYLTGESNDPRDNNLISGDNILGTAIGFGGIEGAAWGFKKYAGFEYKRALRPQKSIFGGLESTFNPGALSRLEARTARNQLLESAGALTKYAKIFGFASIAVMGIELGRNIVKTSRSHVVGQDELAQARRKNIYSGNDEYFDSRAAFTQRQRAIQVIHNSQMSTRAAMGQEASFLHT